MNSKIRHAQLAAPYRRRDGRSLYWAYGSNLNIRAMHKRCPAAIPLYAVMLDDAALVFRGVADMVFKRHSVCAGGVWSITRDCEAALDRYEGVDSGLYCKRYFDLPMRKSGLLRPVLYYKMKEHGICPPSSVYLATIEQGYHDFGLDVSHLEQALGEAWEEPKVTPRIAKRYHRKGQPKLAARNSLSEGRPLTGEDYLKGGLQ